MRSRQPNLRRLNRANQRMPRYRAPNQNGVITIENKQQFEKIVTRRDRVVVVHYGAEWSELSVRLRQVINDMSSKAEFAQIIFVDVDVERQSLQSLAAGVQAVPSCRIFVAGKVQDQFIAQQTADLAELVRKVRNAKQLAITTLSSSSTGLRKLLKNPVVMIPVLSSMLLGTVFSLRAVLNARAAYYKQFKTRVRSDVPQNFDAIYG